MSYKKKIYWIIAISIVATLASLVLALPENSGLCGKNDMACIDGYINRYDILATLLLFFSAPIFIISFILLFLQEQVFHTWSKFSIIFLSVAVVLIAMAPTINGTLIGFDKESATLWLATIFLVISLFIIVVKSFKLRGEGK